MGRQIPTPADLLVREVRPIQETRNGNLFLECVTDIGVVAFWGTSQNRANIDRILSLQPPLEVTAGCIDSSLGWEQHSKWCPQTATIAFRE